MRTRIQQQQTVTDKRTVGTLNGAVMDNRPIWPRTTDGLETGGDEIWVFAADGEQLRRNLCFLHLAGGHCLQP